MGEPGSSPLTPHLYPHNQCALYAHAWLCRLPPSQLGGEKGITEIFANSGDEPPGPIRLQKSFPQIPVPFWSFPHYLSLLSSRVAGSHRGPVLEAFCEMVARWPPSASSCHTGAVCYQWNLLFAFLSFSLGWFFALPGATGDMRLSHSPLFTPGCRVFLMGGDFCP